MIEPVSVGGVWGGVSPTTNDHPTSNSSRALSAAESFNALLLEKMLNSNTDLRAENNPDISLAMKTSEYLYNTKIAELVSATNIELNKQIANEIDNAKR